MSSHDMEDLIALLDGRLEIVQDIRAADKKIRRYLAEKFAQFLGNNEFLEALSGHLPPDQASQQRAFIIEERMRQIIAVY